MIGGLCTKCGHGKQDHTALDPQCSAPRCTCLKYRPAASTFAPPPAPALAVVPTPKPAPSGPHPLVVSVEDLLRACQRSESKRTQAAGVKLAELAEKIRASLRAEREAAEAKAKQSEEFAAKKAAVDRLAKQLAAAKAELRKVKPAAPAVDDAEMFACDECGDAFTTSAGRARHITRKHKPVAS